MTLFIYPRGSSEGHREGSRWKMSPPATSRHAYTKKMSYSKWLNFNLLPKKDQGQSFYQVLRPQIESILAKGRMWEKSSTTRIENRGVVLCIPVARWDAVMKISALLQWFWTLRHGLAVVKCGNAHLVWDNRSSDPFCVHILCSWSHILYQGRAGLRPSFHLPWGHLCMGQSHSGTLCRGAQLGSARRGSSHYLSSIRNRKQTSRLNEFSLVGHPPRPQTKLDINGFEV